MPFRPMIIIIGLTSGWCCPAQAAAGHSVNSLPNKPNVLAFSINLMALGSERAPRPDAALPTARVKFPPAPDRIASRSGARVAQHSCNVAATVKAAPVPVHPRPNGTVTRKGRRAFDRRGIRKGLDARISKRLLVGAARLARQGSQPAISQRPRHHSARLVWPATLSSDNKSSPRLRADEHHERSSGLMTSPIVCESSAAASPDQTKGACKSFFHGLGDDDDNGWRGRTKKKHRV